MSTNLQERKNQMPTIVLPVISDLLKEVEECYKKEEKLSVELLQALHSFLGGILIRATELLDNGSFTQYQTRDGIRKVYRIRNRHEQYTLFKDINFCHCQSFKYQVLHFQNDVTCKHVLAAKLAKLTGQFKVEIVTEGQITDILNDQIELEH